MTKMRAKFLISHIEKREGYITVNAGVTQDGSEENKKINSLQPAGNLNIDIDESSTFAEYLKAGEEFYIDFIKVKK
ncbi:hypothetical protein MUK70_11990 [Dyadobacter chenwenxiniae]|uniref:Uncharacterized protein n=1 Tax=Dyadobacter chenwenxiniae TaxID=2906456 RepID=A0A9X1PFX2_9BACT|nr:hypothetical protein [Dyadobacter chenwenxiniae]MCF0059963.1 hypothetical protein [Dyadobacter chenwenxiniae]UON85702.1 hypothetical protein MUK70_11990 [Dyadobacter chenwenxiniae]